MEETIRHLTRVLGAKNVQAAGHETMFAVEDEKGAKLRCSITGTTQHMMLVLVDPNGTTRTTLDVGPVTEAFEEPDTPGRVTLRVGNQLVHVDGQPSVGIEIESIKPADRHKSARWMALQREVT